MYFVFLTIFVNVPHSIEVELTHDTISGSDIVWLTYLVVLPVLIPCAYLFLTRSGGGLLSISIWRRIVSSGVTQSPQ